MSTSLDDSFYFCFILISPGSTFILLLEEDSGRSAEPIARVYFINRIDGAEYCSVDFTA